MLQTIRCVAACVVFLSTLAHAQPATTRSAETRPATRPADAIRVMSFNIRTGVAPDGANAWPLRTQLVFDTIAAFDPDLLGVQEATGFQRTWLRERFAGYSLFGVGRTDGRDNGEGAPLLFRSDRFDVLAAGHFWLSETPDVPGSLGWDGAFPRIATWARLRDRRGGQVFVFANAHFDHRGRVARERSAGLMREQLARYADGVPVIVTGDFNAAPDSPPYRTLLGTDWRDTLRVVHPTPAAGGEGTSHPFNGKPGPNRIDWIVTSPEWTISAAEIDRATRDGRYPSDHFPVTATVALPSTRPAAGE